MFSEPAKKLLKHRIHDALNVATDILSDLKPFSVSAIGGAIAELGQCAEVARNEGQGSIIPHLQETAERLEKLIHN